MRRLSCWILCGCRRYVVHCLRPWHSAAADRPDILRCLPKRLCSGDGGHAQLHNLASRLLCPDLVINDAMRCRHFLVRRGQCLHALPGRYRLDNQWHPGTPLWQRNLLPRTAWLIRFKRGHHPLPGRVVLCERLLRILYAMSTRELPARHRPDMVHPCLAGLFFQQCPRPVYVQPGRIQHRWPVRVHTMHCWLLCSNFQFNCVHPMSC